MSSAGRLADRARGAPDLSTPEAEREAFRDLRREGSLELRNALVEAHRELIEFHVRHYSRRGVAEDDLRQVGGLALVNAVDRFDPEMGVSFGTFAGRTIDGEVKRWFRDRTWSVRPPRRAQELHLHLRRATDDLTQELGRTPLVGELAARVGASEDLVIEALEAGQAHSATSIDAPSDASQPDAPQLGDRMLGVEDDGYDAAEDKMIVANLLAGLDEREQEILRLRFFDRLSQEEIAERVGVSQSYLSRVLRRTLLRLREEILANGKVSDGGD